MIPLVVEIEIVYVRVVEYHGYDLRIEMVEHVMVRRRIERVILTGTPEHCLVGSTLSDVEGRVGGLHAPRLFPFDRRYRHVVTCRVRRFREIDVSSVSRGEFLRDRCDCSVGWVDGVNQRIELSELVLSASPSGRYRLDHDNIAVRHLDTPGCGNDAVLLRGELRGRVLPDVPARLDVRRRELLLGRGVRSSRSSG